MTIDLASPGRKLALKGVLAQCIVGVSLIILSIVFYSQQSISVALGVIAFVLPHSVFAYWVFRYAGATKNNIVAQSLNQGMRLKLILSIIIFVIAFSQFHAHLGFLLGAYVTTMVSQWLAMFCLSPRS